LNDKFEKLDKKSPIPLYYQLKSYIENQIETGVWEPGTQIPSEQEISEQFQVSRTTIRQALGEMVNEGKLERIQGRGTFVSEISIEKYIERVSGFSQDMRNRGIVPSSDILLFNEVPAPPQAVKALNINDSESTILLKRLRKGNSKRIAIESVYLSYEKFKDLLSIDIGNNSLYEIMSKNFDIWPKRSHQVIKSIKCPTAEARLLGIEIGDPIFLFYTTAFDQNNQPIEYTEGYYRGDRYVLHITNIINSSSYSK
jgi:GntR family transcriptional regulator